jgi:predicted extracellular nuclease
MMHRFVSLLAVVSALGLPVACFDDPSMGSGGGSSAGETESGSTTTDSTAADSTLGDPDTTGSGPTTGPDPTDATGDATSDDATSTGPGGDTDTIYEIQSGDVPRNSEVTITEVIATGIGDNGLFIQDPRGGQYSGIWVFAGMSGPTLPALGDVVNVTGTYDEYFELSEIDVSAGEITVVDSPGAANVPAPASVTTAELGEPWEGVHVRIGADTYTVSEVAAMNDEFRVVDRGGAAIWVDDELFSVPGSGAFDGLSVGSTFGAIQGPLHYTFDEFKIAPRAASDLEGYVP